MSATRAATGGPVGSQPAPPGRRAFDHDGPGAPGSGMETGEAFLWRFGDAIDDRIAEILDELLDERDATHQPRRLPHILAAVGLTLTLALAASVLLRHDPLAAWTIWPSAAAICLAITWATRTRNGSRRL